MTQMVRKQIYITRSQQALLRRLSVLRGLSQSEIIRQAIEREGASGAELAGISDSTTLEEIIAAAINRQKLGTSHQAYQWDREDVYTERLDRYSTD
jgi:hypothetical protein